MYNSDSLFDSLSELDKATFSILSLDSDDEHAAALRRNQSDSDEVVAELPKNTLKTRTAENVNTIDLTLTPEDKCIKIKKFNHKSVASTSRKKKKVVITLSDSSGDENVPPKTEPIERKATSVNRQPQRRISFSSDDSDDDVSDKVRDNTAYRSSENIYNQNDSDSNDISFENFLSKYKTPKSQKPAPSYDSCKDDSFIVTTTDEENDDLEYHLTVKKDYFIKPLVRNDDRECFPKTPKSKTKEDAGDVKSWTLPRNHKVKDKYASPSNDDKARTLSHRASTKLSFMASLSADADLEKCDPEAVVYRKNFVKHREELAYKLYSLFNKKVFFNELPREMEISWNPRLLKTAGYCRQKRNGKNERFSKIELAPKVLDDPGRLRDTLVHEMCHAATWILDGTLGHHGPIWKKWARMVHCTIPEIPLVTRCHRYKISTKYTYKCTQVQCSYSIGRHSKSIDLERKCCPRCRSKLQVFRGDVECSSVEPRGFAAFVKENYSSVKKSNSGLKHGDVMKQLSSAFATKLKVDE